MSLLSSVKADNNFEIHNADRNAGGFETTNSPWHHWCSEGLQGLQGSMSI